MTSRIPGVVLLLGALVLSSLAAGQETSRQPFSAERSWEIQRIGAPTLSPDGRFAVSAVTRYDIEENEGAADLWLWTTDGKEMRRLTTDPGERELALVQPDGKRVAFVAQRDKDKAPQLYVIPISGGEAVGVTNVPTGVAQPKWFPDGKKLAFLTRVWPDFDRFLKQESASRSARTRRARCRSGKARPCARGTPGSTIASSTCSRFRSKAARPRR